MKVRFIDPTGREHVVEGLPGENAMRCATRALIPGVLGVLDRLEAALRLKEMRAVDTFGLLFGRPIDDSIYGLATGEAMAHLRYLERAGRAKLEIRDGVGWYHAA